MSNCAVITTEEKKLGVYVHWNGGIDSVTAFLTFCKLKDYRTPENDDYGWARLTQCIGTFFGGDTSVGVNLYDRLYTKGDNGVYIIENWEIVGRENGPDFDDPVDKKKVKEIVEYINSRYPDGDRIPQKTINEHFKDITRDDDWER